MKWPTRFEGPNAQRQIRGYLLSQPAIRSRISFTPSDQTKPSMLQITGLYNFQSLTAERRAQIAEDCDHAATDVRQLEKSRTSFTLPETRHLMMNAMINQMRRHNRGCPTSRESGYFVPASEYSVGIDVLARPLRMPHANSRFPGWLTPFYDIEYVPRISTVESNGARKYKSTSRFQDSRGTWSMPLLAKFHLVPDGDQEDALLSLEKI